MQAFVPAVFGERNSARHRTCLNSDTLQTENLESLNSFESCLFYSLNKVLHTKRKGVLAVLY